MKGLEHLLNDQTNGEDDQNCGVNNQNILPVVVETNIYNQCRQYNHSGEDELGRLEKVFRRMLRFEVNV